MWINSNLRTCTLNVMHMKPRFQALRSLGINVSFQVLLTLQKKTRTLPKNTTENVMVIMGIVLVLMETIFDYWYVMDYIGGMLNPNGKSKKRMRREELNKVEEKHFKTEDL